MLPTLVTLFFAALGFASLWSLMKDLGAGSTTNRGITFTARENPGGFYLTMFCKAGFVSFAIAVVLHALGLIGDPVVWMHANLPFLMPR